MNNPLRALEDYELFLYSLAEQFKSVHHSTVTLVRRGASLARVSGELHFESGVRLVVVERILADRRPVVIDAYGYEVWRGPRKLYWYDCQPHPDDPTLQASFPHHKHIEPDIKHHRIQAPRLSFSRPNIPELIVEIEAMIASAKPPKQG